MNVFLFSLMKLSRSNKTTIHFQMTFNIDDNNDDDDKVVCFLFDCSSSRLWMHKLFTAAVSLFILLESIDAPIILCAISLGLNLFEVNIVPKIMIIAQIRYPKVKQTNSFSRLWFNITCVFRFIRSHALPCIAYVSCCEYEWSNDKT